MIHTERLTMKKFLHLLTSSLRPWLLCGLLMLHAGLAWSQTGLTPTTSVTAPVTKTAGPDNPYGLIALWTQGDWIAKACLLLLVVMSIASWAILISKLLQLRVIDKQWQQAQKAIANPAAMRTNIAQLPANSPYKLIGLLSLQADEQHRGLKNMIDWDRWMIRAIEQGLSKIQIQVQNGLSLLATIGSTAPFVGLFGTVWAIYSALVKIGVSGQASIDRVAGPVGEALIMTAIGLAVAVPAVFGYNWLIRRNRLALESVRSFGTRMHTLLMAESAGQ
jgi:biopolymer transport protein ExbB